jgi:hypothetical protein
MALDCRAIIMRRGQAISEVWWYLRQPPVYIPARPEFPITADNSLF